MTVGIALMLNGPPENTPGPRRCADRSATSDVVSLREAPTSVGRLHAAGEYPMRFSLRLSCVWSLETARAQHGDGRA